MNLATVSGNLDRLIGSLKDDPASGFIEYATHSFTLGALHLVQKLGIDTHFPLDWQHYYAKGSIQKSNVEKLTIPEPI